MTPVEAKLRAAIAELGPRPFSEVMELALYDEDGGFYATSGRAGRRGGDFLTSPEVGPLFGAVVARALDRWWRTAGSPERWTVVEAGAGPGTLARSVLAARPACAGALRYVLVERSASQRARHADLQELHSRPDLPTVRELGRQGGPAAAGPVVVLANELLDNLPFDVFELAPGSAGPGWREVRVGVDPGDGTLAELLRDPASAPGVPEAWADGELALGARIPRQRSAQRWLADALALADAAGPGSRVVAIDYAATTLELAHRPPTGPRGWLRTYRGHEPGGPPLEALGTQDLTCEVALDQLAAVRPPTATSSQADWLRAHGIDELVEEGRRTWRERAHLGDLEAVRARSRVHEAEALLDPAGLGAFTVVEWEVGP